MTREQKKLLILGATHSEISVVERARAMGIYTIVTDNHTDWSAAPAKGVADEAWNISWSDINALAAKSREAGVDGVIAGFSEFRVENMIKLCHALSLPCYINEEQLDITRDKVKFKQLCREFDIPAVREYSIDDPGINFPVIIKPVDRAGSIGINVAYNERQYAEYLDLALSLSPSKRVIVEDFIADGVKFECFYVINNGVVELMGTNDTLMHSLSTPGHETIQKAWIWPSLNEQDFIEHYDSKYRDMIRSLGFKNGHADISCFYKDGICYVFEAGFRLTGEHSYDYQYAMTGSDHVQSMIRYALGMPTDDYTGPTVRPQALIYMLYATTPTAQVVKSINGLDSLKNDPKVIAVVPEANIGSQTKVNKPTKFAMITMLADNYEDVRNRIDSINKNVTLVTDSNVYHADADMSDEELKRYWPC